MRDDDGRGGSGRFAFGADQTAKQRADTEAGKKIVRNHQSSSINGFMPRSGGSSVERGIAKYLGECATAFAGSYQERV